jgi:hypothetical protein
LAVAGDMKICRGSWGHGKLGRGAGWVPASRFIYAEGFELFEFLNLMGPLKNPLLALAAVCDRRGFGGDVLFADGSARWISMRTCFS